MRYRRKKNYWQQAIHWSEYLRIILTGILVLALIAYLFYESWWAVLALIPLLFLWFRVWEASLADRKRLQFQLQFKDALHAVSAALNVGYSVENAWREGAKEMQIMYGERALICKEFLYMVRQLEMNVTMETILMEFAERTGDEEVQTFGTVFVMAKRSGGNLMEMIRTATSRIADKVDLKREMGTVIASKKMEFYIMTVIPLAMIGYMKLCFGGFLRSLYGNFSGVLIMTVCLIIYLTAFGAGRKIIEIEV